MVVQLSTIHPLSSSDGNADGFGIGAKVGFHIGEIFFAGIDGRYSMPEFEDTKIGYHSNGPSTNWGPVIGIQTPVAGLRVWGSYIAGGEFNPEKSGNVDVVFKDLTGFRIGSGFYVNQVSLNLEYQEASFGQTDLEQLGPFSPGTIFNSVKRKIILGLQVFHFPLKFSDHFLC